MSYNQLSAFTITVLLCIPLHAHNNPWHWKEELMGGKQLPLSSIGYTHQLL